MAWERRGKSVYFYRSRRTASGRVVKDYLGRGPRAARAARDVALAKARRAADACAAASAAALLAEPDRVAAQAVDAARLVAEAALLVSGFHWHNYSWRKRRVRRDEGTAARDPQ